MTLFLLFNANCQVLAGQQVPLVGGQFNKGILEETRSCRQCDLSGVDLTRLDLSFTDLSGANLSRANLSLANLSGAMLRDADLRGAILNGADLGESDMRGANLRGASLAGAYLRGAKRDTLEIDGYPQDHAQVGEVEQGITLVKEAVQEDKMESSRPQNLTVGGTSLQELGEGQSLVMKTPPPSAEELLAQSVPLPSAAPPAVKDAPAIQQVQIEEKMRERGDIPALLSVGKEHFVSSGDNGDQVSGQEPPVSDQDQRESQGPAVITQALGIVHGLLGVFEREEPKTEAAKNGRRLRESKSCYGCDLAGVNLDNAHLRGADLEGADLSHATLRDIDLRGANLKGVNFTGADLTGANLSGADFYKAVLNDADLSDADLEDCLLDGVDLLQARGIQAKGLLLP